MSLGIAGTLAGVRVLDASRVLAGPYAAQILADLGAEVIKVEEPGCGDETRAWGPPYAGDLSAYFMACNRGKKSIALDLKRAEGRDVFLRLAAASDIVLENFRGASAVTLQLTAKDLHAVNPRLVICSISGFGRTGSGKETPGYDFVVQGMSGMMAATGPVDGPPSKFGVAIADLATAFYAVIAVLAGLRGRETSGHGYSVDLALLDCAVATTANVGQAFLVSGKAPARPGNAHIQIVPYQAFAAKDGWVIVAVGNDRQFARFAAAVGRGEWADDARFATNDARVAHRETLVPMIETLMQDRTAREWLEILAKVDVPAGPVWTLPELFASDLARERRLKVAARRPDGTEVELLASPLVKDGILKAPPGLGDDTHAVLQGILGLDEAAIQRLRNSGAVR